MGTPGFPAPSHLRGLDAGVTSQIESHRAISVVVHNSRIAIAAIFAIGIGAAFISICIVFYVISIFLSGFNFSNLFSALVWAVSAFSVGYMCPWLFKMANSMAAHRVTLDIRGINLKLGTKKKPADLFLSWDEVAAIWHKRANNAQYYFVQSRDGSEVQFSSWTFFRPKKIALLIAARTGLSIQEA